MGGREQILCAVTPLWMLWCHCSVGAGCYGAPKAWIDSRIVEWGYAGAKGKYLPAPSVLPGVNESQCLICSGFHSPSLCQRWMSTLLGCVSPE